MRRLSTLLISLALLAACVERPPQLSPADRARIADYISTTAPTPEHPLSVEFEDGLHLLGYRVQQGGEDVEEVTAGTPFTVTWYWHAEEDLDEEYKLFTHGANSAGENVENFDVQGILRSNNLYPPGRWEAGQYVRDVQEITLSPDTWGGQRIVFYLGVWNPEGRLAVTSGPNDGDNRVRALALDVRAPAVEAREPAPPPSVHASRAADITIDGVLDEPAWQSAHPTTRFVNTLNGEAGEVEVTARVLWDDDHLFIAAEIVDAFVTNPHDQRDAALYEHDSFEMMIDPDEDRARNYFELQVSPTGQIFDARYDSRRRPEGGHVSWDSRMEVAVHVDGTANDDQPDRGYTVELALPWSAFEEGDPPGTRPEPDASWRMNFYVFDERQDHGVRSAGWSPTLTGDFHVPNRFGTVTFDAPVEEPAEPPPPIPTEQVNLPPATMRAIREGLRRGNPSDPSNIQLRELRRHPPAP